MKKSSEEEQTQKGGLTLRYLPSKEAMVTSAPDSWNVLLGNKSNGSLVEGLTTPPSTKMISSKHLAEQQS
ncbi:LOW QUALITY PROTEIN: hypothetical protein YC2023_005966 [Brassica napus]